MSLLEIINIILVAETSACFGLLYFLSIEKGMILEFIGNILLKEDRWNVLIESGQLPIHDLSKGGRVDEKGNHFDENNKPYYVLKEIPKWKKPLGVCQTCTMVWIGVLTYFIYLKALPLFILISVVSNGLLIFRKIA